MSQEKIRQCLDRTFVALANTKAAQQSTRTMRNPPPDVIALLDSARSDLEQALALLRDKVTVP